MCRRARRCCFLPPLDGTVSSTRGSRSTAPGRRRVHSRDRGRTWTYLARRSPVSTRSESLARAFPFIPIVFAGRDVRVEIGVTFYCFRSSTRRTVSLPGRRRAVPVSLPLTTVRRQTLVRRGDVNSAFQHDSDTS